MKKEISNCPELLKEEYGFSWMEHVLAIPSPLVTVTTYKKNGLSNATMQSWCTFVGENGYHVIFGSVNKYGHMYATCKETKCCVVNIPSKEVANSHFLRTAGPHSPDSPGHIKRTVLEISRAERGLRPANQYRALSQKAMPSQSVR